MLTDDRFDLVVPDGAELGVVVLHPHPDYGGDRFNPVVDAIFSAVTAAGCAAVRFDFSSSDVVAASDESRDALTRLPGDVPIAVAGYSFGAGVATQILDRRITRWVLVAPPLTSLDLDLDAIASDQRPKHLLAPVHDQFCPPPDARAATDRWAATTVEPIEGADHFLAGATTRVADRTLELIGARRSV
jgi:uncharacterized protein